MRFKILLLLLMIGLTGSIWVSAQIPSPPIDNPIASIDSDLHPRDASWGSNDILAIGGAYSVRLYDPVTFSLLAELHRDEIIKSVAWNHAGNQLALSIRGFIEIWDWDGSGLVLSNSFPVDKEHNNLEWSPDDAWLASLGVSVDFLLFGRVYLWDKHNNWLPIISPTQFYFEPISERDNNLLDWRPDAQTVALISQSTGLVNSELYITSNPSVFLMEADSLEIIDQFEVPSSARTLDWRSDGSAIAIGFEAGGGIYDLALDDFTHYVMGGALNTTVHWSPDQTKILLGATIVDPYTPMELGLFNVSSAVIVSLWQGDRIFIAQANGRFTIEDPSLARGIYATFTPESYEPTTTPIRTPYPTRTPVSR